MSGDVDLRQELRRNQNRIRAGTGSSDGFFARLLVLIAVAQQSGDVDQRAHRGRRSIQGAGAEVVHDPRTLGGLHEKFAIADMLDRLVVRVVLALRKRRIGHEQHDKNGRVPVTSFVSRGLSSVVRVAAPA